MILSAAPVLLSSTSSNGALGGHGDFSFLQFVYPGWLYALLLLPLVLGWILWDEKRRKSQLSRFIHPRLWNRVIPDLEPDHRKKRAGFLLLGLSFLFLALARPQMGAHEESILTNGLDLMIVLDASSSMDVEDVVPSRLKKAKHVIRKVLDQVGGDRVGLVSFAESSALTCPLTTDLDYVWNSTEMVDPGKVRSQGTDVGIGLDTALRALERGGEGRIEAGGGEGSNDSPTTHVILLISDGEDHEGAAIQVAKRLKEKGIRLSVLGVGTEKGGPIPLKDAQGNSQGFKRDPSGQVVVSTFHPDFLMTVAQEAGGKYWTLTNTEVEVNDFLNDLGMLDRQSYEARRYRVYDERFQIPLFIALVFFICELFIRSRKRGVQESGKAKAIWAGLLLIGVGGSLSPRLSYAESGSSPSVDVYLNNKKGVEAYLSGQMEEARQNFGAAQARDPARPELDFNQGVIELESGNLDRAADAFRKSAEGTSNPELQGRAYYNLAQTLAKKGVSSEAIRNYASAVESLTKTKNSNLEAKARKNLQILAQQEQQQQKQKEKEQQQQKEQQKQQNEKQNQEQNKREQNQEQSKDQQKEQNQKQQDGQKKEDEKAEPKDKNNGDQKDSSSDPNKKDEKDEKQNQPQPEKSGQEEKRRDQDAQNFQQPNPKNRKNPFESKKLSAEDAERAMQQLMNQEKALQDALEKNQPKSHKNPKDW